MGLRCYDYAMNSFQQLALIGSTASGKTALSIQLAQKMDAYILSLDSLAIYREIDIVSAKPTIEERNGIRHFGIDYLYPHEPFDVTTFVSLYHHVYQTCLKEKKNLIIVGGTGFYLKILLEGISVLPPFSDQSKIKTKEAIQDLTSAYQMLKDIDPHYLNHIATTDRYRIEKALLIYFETGMAPGTYFRTHPPVPTINEPLPIYQIVWERDALRQRIALRTEDMLKSGLIDEVCYLEKKYTRAPHCMGAIGIKETLKYLDGKYNREKLKEKISTNTARLAKRQTTFNNSQFKDVTKGTLKSLSALLLK